ncbi:MAG: hypothetical protein AAF632_20720 [Bacteroidota bacterium]
MRTRITLISLLTLFTTTLTAQDADKQIDNQSFKEQLRINNPLSYLSVPYVGDLHFLDEETRNYILTADIEPHFFLFMEENTAFAVDFFAKIKVRILTDRSFPVRTPSYMPGGNLYLRTRFRKTGYDYLSLNFTHHSNGQDGCALNGYTYTDSQGCINTSGNQLPNLSPVLNQNNGNFSTNFLQLGYNIAFEQLENDTTRTLSYYIFKHDDGEFKGDLYNYIYFGYQFHFIGIEEELRGRYGLHQFKFLFQRIAAAYWQDSPVKRFEAERFVAEIAVNLSTIDRLEGFSFHNRFNVDLKYNFTLRGLSSNSTSLFVMAGYKGQDDYNIYFENSFPYVGFGISAGNIIYSPREKSIL